MFLGRFYPNMLADDVYHIDYGRLYASGYRGLVFDIDNTLVPHGAPATESIIAFFRKLHEMGFKTLLLSNNSQERVDAFNRGIGALTIHDAGKPDPAAFRRAAQALNLDKCQIVVIGDTVHTDIAGANRAGIKSILVKYIGHEKKEWKGFRRYLEAFILLFYPLSGKRRII